MTVDVMDDLFAQRSHLGNEYRDTVERLRRTKQLIGELNDAIDANGGINCGWSSGKDHSEYCKLRIRFQGRIESRPFFEEC